MEATLGYFLLYIGLLGLMFFGKTRFKKLAKMLEDIRIKKAALPLILFLTSTLAFAQRGQFPRIIDKKPISFNRRIQRVGTNNTVLFSHQPFNLITVNRNALC